jgi:hypothetical protein
MLSGTPASFLSSAPCSPTTDQETAMDRIKQIIHVLRTDKEARFYVAGVFAIILFLCWWGATGHWDDSPYLPDFLR